MSTGKRVKGVAVYIGIDLNGIYPQAKGAPSGAMSGTAVITSAPIDAEFMDNICIEVEWTGTPHGTFSVQGSVSGFNWKDLGLTISGPVGSVGNDLLDLNQLSFPLVRLVYTNSSSTGTLVMYAGGKAL